MTGIVADLVASGLAPMARGALVATLVAIFASGCGSSDKTARTDGPGMDGIAGTGGAAGTGGSVGTGGAGGTGGRDGGPDSSDVRAGSGGGGGSAGTGGGGDARAEAGSAGDGSAGTGGGDGSADAADAPVGDGSQTTDVVSAHDGGGEVGGAEVGHSPIDGGGACPPAPPSSGTPCTGNSCQYESCATFGRVSATCTNGTWSVATGPCATMFCSTGPPCQPGELCLERFGSPIRRDCIANTCGTAAVTCDCLSSCSGTCFVTGSPTTGIHILCNF